MHEPSGTMHERVWQFKLPDKIGEDSKVYFERRAKELAEALNYRLVATSEVKVEPNAAFRLVSGKALVEGSFIVRKGGRQAKVQTRHR
jgi:hypothetical protein